MVRVRFAPSPTGPLHIGGARTVLFNWLFARRHNGSFILRSEDTDLERSSVKWEEDSAQSLRWLGLDWDEGLEVGGPHGPYRQTERLEIYKEYLSRLWLSGHVYYCFCTPEELERDREEAMARGDNPVYSGRCRDLTPAQVGEKLQAGLKPTIRFKVPRDEEIIIQDLIRGEVSFNSRDVGDFIIVKSDGIPTYNYAVVIRRHHHENYPCDQGQRALGQHPRQVLIYQALGRKSPIRPCFGGVGYQRPQDEQAHGGHVGNRVRPAGLSARGSGQLPCPLGLVSRGGRGNHGYQSAHQGL